MSKKIVITRLVALVAFMGGISSLNAMERRGKSMMRQRQFCGKPIRTTAESGYVEILKQFHQLQCEVGIETRGGFKEKKHRFEEMKKKFLKAKEAKGEKGERTFDPELLAKKMKEMNTIRSALNNMLSQKELSEDSITKIKEKISELEALKPMRKPGAQDYQAILDAKIRIAAGLSAQPNITQDFLILEKRAGIHQVYTAENEQKANEIRTELNQLLSATKISSENRIKINEKIKELENLHTKWPSALDYTTILTAIPEPAAE